MIDLKFEIDGKRVDPAAVDSELEKAALKLVANRITKAVGTVRCPEHGGEASVVATGRSLNNLTFKISGCCDRLIEQVRDKLK